MEKLSKLVQTLRNNWKKSLLGTVVLYYGANKAKQRYEINLLMTAACEQAQKYGDALIDIDQQPRVITVILNPVANKRKARADFEKYCEPLLHLAGLQVDIIQTTSEGHAKELVGNLKGTEAIIVAGGDGTLAEAVTGLLRRTDDANQFPIGILPLGRTNTVGNNMFPSGSGVGKVRQLIKASFAVIDAHFEYKDVMKIEPMTESDSINSKPIYALSNIDWGAFKDAKARKDKYWFYGPWREYATYVFNGYKKDLTWLCKGTLRYSPPCEGCSNCVPKQVVKRKWTFFVPETPKLQSVDYSKVNNVSCNQSNELCIKASELFIQPSWLDSSNAVPSLKIGIGKPNYNYMEFVSEGWNRVRNMNANIPLTLSARTVQIIPQDFAETDQISIDNEAFDVKPVKVTLLPKAIKLYSSRLS